ncbi:hypothetical protein JW998_01610, partial [candidate division KSB1 bacterium]|nr:hypothetical protein [candidate division KSB1 bacterium]
VRLSLHKYFCILSLRILCGLAALRDFGPITPSERSIFYHIILNIVSLRLGLSDKDNVLMIHSYHRNYQKLTFYDFGSKIVASDKFSYKLNEKRIRHLEEKPTRM